MPARFENLRELGELHIALLARLRFQHVQSDREFGVAGFDDDQLFTEVSAPPALLRCNEPQQERHGVPVKIEEDETLAALNILTGQVAKEEGFALAGLAQDCQMFGALGLRQMGAASQDLAVDDLEAEIQPGALLGGRFVGSRKPVPDGGNQFFNHGVFGEGIAAGPATTAGPRNSWRPSRPGLCCCLGCGHRSRPGKRLPVWQCWRWTALAGSCARSPAPARSG